jgi:hypothetical protein
LSKCSLFRISNEGIKGVHSALNFSHEKGPPKAGYTVIEREKFVKTEGVKWAEE